MGLIDTIRVPYQGQNVPIQQLGWATPRGNVIAISMYDKTAASATVKALTEAGLSAYNNKQEVIVSVPSPTLDTLEKNRRRIRELAEEGKVAVRKVRQEFRDTVKPLPEDERKRAEKTIQTEIEAAIDRIEADCLARQKSV